MNKSSQTFAAFSVNNNTNSEESYIMQVDEAIRARRAIKWYDPEHQMPEETFFKLIEHAIQIACIQFFECAI